MDRKVASGTALTSVIPDAAKAVLSGAKSVILLVASALLRPALFTAAFRMLKF
jgi:hypothetical protein